MVSRISRLGKQKNEHRTAQLGTLTSLGPYRHAHGIIILANPKGYLSMTTTPMSLTFTLHGKKPFLPACPIYWSLHTLVVCRGRSIGYSSAALSRSLTGHRIDLTRWTTHNVRRTKQPRRMPAVSTIRLPLPLLCTWSYMVTNTHAGGESRRPSPSSSHFLYPPQQLAEIRFGVLLERRPLGASRSGQLAVAFPLRVSWVPRVARQHVLEASNYRVSHVRDTRK